MWHRIMDWFNDIPEKKIEQQQLRYSMYLPSSKCVYIKADHPIYLERELMKHLSKSYFDGWLYEIDIIKGNKKKHLSLTSRKEIKELALLSNLYFK